MADGGAVGVNVVPDFAGFGSLFNSGIRGALRQAEGLGREAGKLTGNGLKLGLGLGLAAAAVGIGDFVGKGIKEFGRLADQTRSLQRLTGASAESASLFASTIAHMGVDVDGASRGLGIFGAHIAAQPELFAKYHVAIAKTASGNNDLLGTLDNLRKAFNGTSDASTRDAAAKALLGRSYQTLLPYLTATDDRLALFQRLARNSGQVLSQADVDKARELKVQVQELKDNIEHLKVTAGRAGTGFLSNFLGGTDILKKTGIGDIGRVLGTSLGLTNLPKHIQDAVNKEQSLAHSAAAAEVSLQEQALAAEKDGAALSGLAGKAQNLRNAQQGVHGAEEALASASRGVVTARRGVVTAHEAAAAAAKGLTKAEYDLAKLEAAGPVDAKAVTSARQSLASANRSVTSTTEALAAAEAHLAEVQAGATADDLEGARLQLDQAEIALKEAKLAQAQPGSATDPYASQKAKLGVDQAVQARKLAQENLTKVQEQGTSADKNLADAQRSVRDATQAAADAVVSQTDAQLKLSEAQAGDPDFQQKLADAKDAVATATIGVRDAQYGEADAAQAVRDAQQQVTDAHTALADASYQARDAQYALDAEWQKAVDSGANLGHVLDDLKQKYPELTGLLRQYNDEVARGQTFTGGGGGSFGGHGASGSWDDPNFSGSGASGSWPKRAAGGRVVPGQTYWVGEQGPEPFVPDQAGTILPSGAASRLIAQEKSALAAGTAGDDTQPLILHVVLQDGTLLGKIDSGLRVKRKAYSR